MKRRQEVTVIVDELKGNGVIQEADIELARHSVKEALKKIRIQKYNNKQKD